MKRKRLILFSAAAVMILISLIGLTYGWFVTVKRTGNLIFSVGNVKYNMNSIGDSFISKDFIVPGEELLKENKDLEIKNLSTIGSSLRIKIALLYKDGTETKIYELGPDETGFLIGQMFDTWEYLDGEYDAETSEYTDGYWYYKDEIPKSELTDGTSISILESLKINGNKAGKAMETRNITIKIFFQGKQYNYALWSDLAELEIKL